mmetsp:Transcript_6534/g.13334  ORF Transcript_6534/g.13334 Transcript_6534/m.13334 type:complete len:218 (-) Transcript_6534:59-712(-)
MSFQIQQVRYVFANEKIRIQGQDGDIVGGGGCCCCCCGGRRQILVERRVKQAQFLKAHRPLSHRAKGPILGSKLVWKECQFSELDARQIRRRGTDAFQLLAHPLGSRRGAVLLMPLKPPRSFLVVVVVVVIIMVGPQFDAGHCVILSLGKVLVMTLVHGIVHDKQQDWNVRLLVDMNIVNVCRGKGRFLVHGVAQGFDGCSCCCCGGCCCWWMMMMG